MTFDAETRGTDIDHALVSLGERMRAENAARLQQAVDAAQVTYWSDPVFHMRARMLAQAMELRGHEFSIERAVEYMAALAFIESETARYSTHPDATH